MATGVDLNNRKIVEEIVWLTARNCVLKNTCERCRSKVNHDYKDLDGNYSQYKRFNWGVHTLNLGQVALKAIRDGGGEESFFRHLKNSVDIMEDAIKFRFNHIKDMKAKDAPILFMYGGLARLNAEDSIEHLLRSDISSVSFGYMGIDDATRILLGETIKDENGKEFGLKLMETIRKYSDEMKERLEKLSKKNRLFKIKEKKQEPAPEPETKICPFCFSEINYKAVKCPHCTSDLN